MNQETATQGYGYQCHFFTSSPESTMQTMMVYGITSSEEAKEAIKWFIGQTPRLLSCVAGRYHLPDKWIEVTHGAYEYKTREEKEE